MFFLFQFQHINLSPFHFLDLKNEAYYGVHNGKCFSKKIKCSIYEMVSPVNTFFIEFEIRTKKKNLQGINQE